MSLFPCDNPGLIEKNVFPMRFFNTGTYKDCLIMYADEFIAIEPVDRRQEFQQLIDSYEYSLTGVSLKVTEYHPWLELRNTLNTELNNLKQIKRGVIHESSSA